ncbi:single-stranded-DNA-specific exonuclease RecJ [Zavarzinella formosa]|uniref:single-stranded-DNA-specific exonuclease RecJ n=1 Tax=Zavarzinella formosa TaxID=360055 RepID=UPI00030C37CF|nr:single-stranded-DNA-specific exonuclease RecJ [Zavarzinella formosa]
MPAVTKLWRLLPHDRTAIEHLARQLGVSPIIAQLLLNRDIGKPEAAKRFLEASLAGMHPPASLPGVPEAVERLYRAVEQKKKICVYGDYDVDGTTGTAILVGLFQQLGSPVEFYVPHRLEEGYGVNSEALTQLAESGVKVVVTVDCGIASLAEADVAKKLGLELIVTDHHEMKATLPKAAVCVHPRLPGTNYPFGGLSGAGVAFKLAWALAVKHCGSEKVTPALRDYLLDALCLATLGLVADVVPLHDENRILVKHGLNRLNTKPPLGIKALIESAKLPADKLIKAEDIGYKLGPRINAAGRLGCARLVVEMFTTANPAKAREVADFLDNQNSQRQTIERKMTAQAKEMADAMMTEDLSGIVLAHAEWHPGVVGIVASRIVEYTGCPAVLFAIVPDAEVVTGSGRSIHGFELHEALNACDDVLAGHGGHAMAAGAKIRPLMIPVFRERFAQYAAEHFPTGVAPAPQVRIDAEVPLSSLTLGLLNDLNKLEPYGADNPKPRFLAGNLQIVGEPKKIGAGERHLSFKVKQGSTSMRAVAFGMGDRVVELMSDGGRCCLTFTPTINEWNGMRSVELMVDDFQTGPTATLG